MASKLITIQKYLWDTYSIPVQVEEYKSTGEYTMIRETNGNNATNLNANMYIQLLVKRENTNSSKAYEEAERDSVDILNKIKECVQVMNPIPVPIGYENGSYMYSINFQTYKEVL